MPAISATGQILSIVIYYVHLFLPRNPLGGALFSAASKDDNPNINNIRRAKPCTTRPTLPNTAPGVRGEGYNGG
jgi:hypothetical protein